MNAADFPLLSEIQYNDLVQRWNEPHRAWHAMSHVKELLRCIEKAVPELAPDDQAFLRYLALFHDAVYDPLSVQNEEDSADLAAQYLPNFSRVTELTQAILATKTHQSKTALESLFNQWDCSILHDADPVRLDAYEKGIAFEYRVVDSTIYLRERCKFLRKAAQTYQNPALAGLADRIESTAPGPR